LIPTRAGQSSSVCQVPVPRSAKQQKKRNIKSALKNLRHDIKGLAQYSTFALSSKWYGLRALILAIAGVNSNNCGD